MDALRAVVYMMCKCLFGLERSHFTLFYIPSSLASSASPPLFIVFFPLHTFTFVLAV